MKHQYYRLEALTPIHIGTGESLDPFSYVIKNGELHYVDLTGWVESHPDPEGLAKKLSGEVHAVRAHIAETIDLAKFSLSSAKVLSKSILDEYRQKLKDPRNQLKIAPAMKNAANHSLVIPGSSIKGAIRTAVIDMLDREHNLNLKKATQDDNQQRSKTKQYEACLKSVLGDIGSNVFKNLKVSDFEAPPGISAIITANEIGKKPDKQPTPKDPCEVLPGACMGASVFLPGKIGIGAATAAEPKGENLVISFAKEKLSFNAGQLAGLCCNFYRKHYLEEKKTFYGLPHFAKTARALEAVEKLVLDTPPGAFLLRIGHYSHVECMTITDNMPDTRRIKGRQLPFGTTRTLAEGIYPFGWVRLLPCSREEYSELLDQLGKTAEAFRYEIIAPVAKTPPTPLEQIKWNGATLSWNPGNQTLIAQSDGKKVEIKLAADKSLVPEALHRKLFVKKDAVKADVTVEQQGNAWRLVMVGLTN